MKRISILLLIMPFQMLFAQQGIQKIVSKEDSNEHYSFYAPNEILPGKKYPLIIFLDPAARGDLPISKYRELADRYHVYVAGSFNSKNFDAESSIKAVQAIYNELVASYPINKDSVILAGFSGGSRAASQIAILNENLFLGIIACGAGFGGVRMAAGTKLSYASLVGDKDMNYSELLQLHEELDSLRNRNVIFIFDGDHDWPPPAYMELAIAWLLGAQVSNEQLIILKTKWKDSLSVKTSDPQSLYSNYFNIKELARITTLDSFMDSLAATIPRKSLKKDKQLLDDALNQERDYDISFQALLYQVAATSGIDSLHENDWQEKLQEIALMKKSPTQYVRLAGIRCADVSFRMGIEYCIQSLKARNFFAAYNVGHICTLFSPTNFNAPFFMAEAAAALNNKQLAFDCLRLAVKNGLSQPERVLSDSLLLKLFTRTELKSLFP